MGVDGAVINRSLKQAVEVESSLLTLSAIQMPSWRLSLQQQECSFFVPRTAVGKLDVLCFHLMPFKDNI
jgi:hypothetical protein